ncbi:MAG: hypothetical protein Q8S11_14040 [Daejeonella sp.]|nr:hypothetical protein [Daejeonella sp.]
MWNHRLPAYECNTIIPAARNAAGHTSEEILESLRQNLQQFSKNVKEKFNRTGEF